MYRLALFFFLVPAAVAQTAAPDTALVNRLTRALGLDADVSVSVSSTDPSDEPSTLTTVRLADSVEVAVAQDYRPALLSDALAVLEGGAYQRLDAVQKAWMAEDQGQETMMAVMRGGGPADAPRADSVLVVDYVDAHLQAARPDDVRRESFQAARAAMDASARAALDGAGFFAAMDQQQGPGHDRERLLSVRMARLQLAGADPDDVRAVTTYYRSEAGQYVGRRVAIGRSRAQLPVLVSSLESMAQRFQSATGQ